MTTNVTRYPETNAEARAKRTITAFGILTRRADSEIFNAQSNLAKFKSQIDKDPCYAFSWADGNFRSAAALNIWTRIKHQLEDGATMIGLRDEARRYVIQAARHPVQSTSICSNLIETYATSVWAEVLELLEECVKHSTTDEA